MNNNTAEFEAWPKIPRDYGEIITITEKLDGTNACIVIEDNVITGVQSRKRMIQVGDDNYGFAAWVDENSEELLKLGDGRHFGEWIGGKIQSNPYDVTEKRFYMFNSARWGAHNPNTPKCCHVVPVLYSGPISSTIIEQVFEELKTNGSNVETGENYKGYVEGIIVYYNKTRRMTKDTYEYREGKHSTYVTT
jgi:hypothetical protein